MSDTSSGRRSAREWAQLVREWKRSGLTAGEFADQRGLASRTLSWWHWKLARDECAKREVDQQPAIELVRVHVEDAHRELPSSAPCVWELVMATGHTLRVHTRLDADELRALIAAVMSSGTHSS